MVGAIYLGLRVECALHEGLTFSWVQLCVIQGCRSSLEQCIGKFGVFGFGTLLFEVGMECSQCVLRPLEKAHTGKDKRNLCRNDTVQYIYDADLAGECFPAVLLDGP